jgi:hypothetical protein
MLKKFNIYSVKNMTVRKCGMLEMFESEGSGKLE